MESTGHIWIIETSLLCLSRIHGIRSQTSSASNYGSSETAILVRDCTICRNPVQRIMRMKWRWFSMVLRPQIRIPKYPMLRQLWRNVNDLWAIRKQISRAANQALLTKMSHTINIWRTYSSNHEWSLRRIIYVWRSYGVHRADRHQTGYVRPFRCYGPCFDSIRSCWRSLIFTDSSRRNCIKIIRGAEYVC